MLSFYSKACLSKALSKQYNLEHCHGSCSIFYENRKSWLFYFSMKNNLQKNILLISILSFIPFYFAFANSPLKDFQIPSQLGTIKEVFEAPNPQPSVPTIIQIQDAHCNYEAQKNLAQILEYLAKEKKLRLIMVEGGSGNVSLSFLRSFADKSAREEIADKYLRSGKISGEEYLDIVSDYDLELYGIEDPDLYDTNLDSFLNIEGYKEQGLKDTGSLRGVIEALKPHMYNQQLLQLDEKKSQFEKKSIPLAEYCAYLKDTAVQKRVKYDSFVQLRSFQESLELEKTIDFKQVEVQRSAFIKDLAKKLEGQAIKDLIAKTQAFKDKKISPQEFYSFLKLSAQDKLDIATSYPQFDTYMRYVSMGKNIEVDDLIKEVSSLEAAVRQALFINNDERRLSDISHSVDVLERFLKLDLTPAEYDVMQTNPSNYMTATWINFLADSCRRYQLALRPEMSGIIDDNFDALDTFYKVGIDREQAFLRNIQQKIKRVENNSYVVVITGGFHTTGLNKLFKEQGYSYAVVTPAITKKSDPEIYFSVLRDQMDRDENTMDSD
jgi:hypothetical protein